MCTYVHYIVSSRNYLIIIIIIITSSIALVSTKKVLMALATIKQNFPFGCPRYPPAVQRPRKIKKSNVYWMLLKYFWKKMGLQVSFWKCVLSGWLCWNGGLPSGSHGIMAAILVVHWWTLTQLLHTPSHWPSHHIIVTVGLFAIFQSRVGLQWLGSRSSFYRPAIRQGPFNASDVCYCRNYNTATKNK